MVPESRTTSDKNQQPYQEADANDGPYNGLRIRWDHRHDQRLDDPEGHRQHDDYY
jgi:hypothetical protein